MELHLKVSIVYIRWRCAANNLIFLLYISHILKQYRYVIIITSEQYELGSALLITT